MSPALIDAARLRNLGRLTFTDLFCGAGGSSSGLVEAGYDLVEALNHDQTSILTHSANHQNARHRCADINGLDKRTLPRTRILWGSPICTEISPAGGRRRTHGQQALDMGDGTDRPAAFDKTRATALDIIAATEIHRYDAVMCENVTEFGTDWELFDWWLAGMGILGYHHQIVCASSAHLGGGGNERAPQLRDRMYVVFTRKDLPLPDLAVRPEAICPECGPVLANQVWRNPRRRKIGKWGQQYDYRCPNKAGHLILEPTTRPVSDIINWDLPGTVVGDGKPKRKVFTPYADSTRARIQEGLDRFGHEPHITMLRNNCSAVPLTSAVPTLAASGQHHALIVPNGRKGVVRTTDGPLTTVACREHHSLVRTAPTVDECTIRMMSTEELMETQRFSKGYIVHGTLKQRVSQAGNAVSVNAARWLGERVMAVLS